METAKTHYDQKKLPPGVPRYSSGFQCTSLEKPYVEIGDPNVTLWEQDGVSISIQIGPDVTHSSLRDILHLFRHSILDMSEIRVIKLHVQQLKPLINYDHFERGCDGLFIERNGEEEDLGINYGSHHFAKMKLELEQLEKLLIRTYRNIAESSLAEANKKRDEQNAHTKRTNAVTEAIYKLNPEKLIDEKSGLQQRQSIRQHGQGTTWQ